MKVGAYIEIVVVIALVAALLIGGGYLIVWKTTKNNAGVRKAEFERMRKQRDSAIEAVNKVEDLTGKHVDIMLDTPLATDIKKVLREYEAARRRLE
jgi:type II secretory pathway component PulM